MRPEHHPNAASTKDQTVSLQTTRRALLDRWSCCRGGPVGGGFVRGPGVVYLARHLSLQAAHLGAPVSGGVRLGVAAVISARPGTRSGPANRTLFTCALSAGGFH